MLISHYQVANKFSDRWLEWFPSLLSLQLFWHVAKSKATEQQTQDKRYQMEKFIFLFSILLLALASWCGRSPKMDFKIIYLSISHNSCQLLIYLRLSLLVKCETQFHVFGKWQTTYKLQKLKKFYKWLWNQKIARIKLEII